MDLTNSECTEKHGYLHHIDVAEGYGAIKCYRLTHTDTRLHTPMYDTSRYICIHIHSLGKNTAYPLAETGGRRGHMHAHTQFERYKHWHSLVEYRHDPCLHCVSVCVLAVVRPLVLNVTQLLLLVVLYHSVLLCSLGRDCLQDFGSV